MDSFLTLLVFVFLVPLSSASEICLQLTPSPTLEKFVDPLPIMPKIYLFTTPSAPLVMGAFKITQKLHTNLPATSLYAFGTSQSTASYPGPTLIAGRYFPAYVRWQNNLTDMNHFLPVDNTIDRATPSQGYVPLVVHLHGMESEAPSDGHPDSWFTYKGDTGSGFVTQTYEYKNPQAPAMFWYHDHSFGFTRLNVASGLAGLYLELSPWDDPSWLPKSLVESSDENLVNNSYVFHLLVQDKQFFQNGTIKYPDVGINPQAHPQWCPDYFGDVVVVNGKIWPYLNVTRRIYRFRVLNGGNSRFLLLSLSNPNLSFVKIGTDGGYLSTPIRQKQVRIAPAERVDLLIDFRNASVGTNVTMVNVAPAPFPSGPMVSQDVMLFRVVSANLSGYNETLPATLTPNQTAEKAIYDTTGFNVSTVNLNSIKRRDFVLGFGLDAAGGLTMLNSDGSKTFRDPPTEIVKLYTYELWEFINNVPGVAHPIHIHLINFIVLNQQAYNQSRFVANACTFNVSYPNPASCFTEAPRAPDDDQLGWKDTAVVQPFVMTRFLVPFMPRDPRPFVVNATKAPGYIWHCHLLEHEDNEMMRPLLFTN